MIGYLFIDNIAIPVNSINMQYLKRDPQSPDCVIELGEEVNMNSIKNSIGTENTQVETLIVYKDIEKTEILWQADGPFIIINLAEHLTRTSIDDQYYVRKVIDYIYGDNYYFIPDGPNE